MVACRCVTSICDVAPESGSYEDYSEKLALFIVHLSYRHHE